jgi:hypothetical protein
MSMVPQRAFAMGEIEASARAYATRIRDWTLSV